MWRFPWGRARTPSPVPHGASSFLSSLPGCTCSAPSHPAVPSSPLEASRCQTQRSVLVLIPRGPTGPLDTARCSLLQVLASPALAAPHAAAGLLPSPAVRLCWSPVPPLLCSVPPLREKATGPTGSQLLCSLSAPPTTAPAGPTAFPYMHGHTPATGPLHLLFPRPRTPPLQRTPKADPSFPPGLCPNVPLADAGQTLDRSQSPLKYATGSDSIHLTSKKVLPVRQAPLSKAHIKTATTQLGRGGWPAQDPAREVLAWSALRHPGKQTPRQGLSV